MYNRLLTDTLWVPSMYPRLLKKSLWVQSICIQSICIPDSWRGTYECQLYVYSTLEEPTSPNQTLERRHTITYTLDSWRRAYESQLHVYLRLLKATLRCPTTVRNYPTGGRSTNWWTASALRRTWKPLKDSEGCLPRRFILSGHVNPNSWYCVRHPS